MDLAIATLSVCSTRKYLRTRSRFGCYGSVTILLLRIKTPLVQKCLSSAGALPSHVGSIIRMGKDLMEKRDTIGSTARTLSLRYATRMNFDLKKTQEL